ncbi:uncharacterized protein LOC108629902 [Ceratina calcarata]|uniref:Uncharacterized protein LOC108629902 n=1 Tax=Ceratina calcarata TaxID=156304 RepID=A0AAJ7J9V2_9HYME|nr:uncharacterized protein LOC108629902 [Ceratina calcarata]
MDEEYYSTLFNWFEKCGVISNIRTHLRQNLINALKTRELVIKSDGPRCAKQYVYDLLIAEYLFNHNYAYTMSVFASEAPLLVNFSDKTFQKPEGGSINKGKLQTDYIFHALETLGINPRDPKGQYVISQYVESDTPLLLCILKCITMFSYNLRDDVPVKDKVSLCNESTQTEFSWKSHSLYVEKLSALKRKIDTHKRTIDDKLREREMMLKEQAVVIEQQLETLNEKLHLVQNAMHNMSLKEKQFKEEMQASKQQILQKEIELTLKERLLSQEANRLNREQDDCKKVARSREPKEVQTGETFDQFLRSIDVQTDGQEDKIEILTREKEELSALIREQQLRIEQITQRALQLSRQVEDIRSLRPATEVPTQTTVIVSESSSTEDILQDAKMRLKRLEEESLKADQYYYNFINNSP